MKLLVTALATGMIFSTPLLATCEDGNAMAEEAAIQNAASIRSIDKTYCKARSEEPKVLKSGDEKYEVTVHCEKPSNSPFHPADLLYTVTLHEEEDAVCTVAKVAYLGQIGRPGVGPIVH